MSPLYFLITILFLLSLSKASSVHGVCVRKSIVIDSQKCDIPKQSECNQASEIIPAAVGSTDNLQENICKWELVKDAVILYSSINQVADTLEETQPITNSFSDYIGDDITWSIFSKLCNENPLFGDYSFLQFSTDSKTKPIELKDAKQDIAHYDDSHVSLFTYSAPLFTHDSKVKSFDNKHMLIKDKHIQQIAVMSLIDILTFNNNRTALFSYGVNNGIMNPNNILWYEHSANDFDLIPVHNAFGNRLIADALNEETLHIYAKWWRGDYDPKQELHPRSERGEHWLGLQQALTEPRKFAKTYLTANRWIYDEYRFKDHVSLANKVVDIFVKTWLNHGPQIGACINDIMDNDIEFLWKIVGDKKNEHDIVTMNIVRKEVKENIELFIGKLTKWKYNEELLGSYRSEIRPVFVKGVGFSGGSVKKKLGVYSAERGYDDNYHLENKRKHIQRLIRLLEQTKRLEVYVEEHRRNTN